MFVDECEILDWDHRAPEPKKSRKRRQNARSMSSHKHVEMANDKKTPLRIQDGEFGMLDSITKNSFAHWAILVQIKLHSYLTCVFIDAQTKCSLTKSHALVACNVSILRHHHSPW